MTFCLCRHAEPVLSLPWRCAGSRYLTDFGDRMERWLMLLVQSLGEPMRKLRWAAWHIGRTCYSLPTAGEGPRQLGIACEEAPHGFHRRQLRLSSIGAKCSGRSKPGVVPNRKRVV